MAPPPPTTAVRAERAHHRLDVAIISPDGSVAYTAFASSVSEARRIAEGPRCGKQRGDQRDR